MTFVGFQVFRKEFLCEFNCVICLVSCTPKLIPNSWVIGGDWKSRFRILLSNSRVIYGDRLFRILFDLSGACLSTQPRNFSFYTRHISFGSEYKSTLTLGSWLRSEFSSVKVLKLSCFNHARANTAVLCLTWQKNGECQGEWHPNL